MSFRVEIPPSVRRRIAAWNLPDALVVEIYLRLRDDLGQNATSCLQRISKPFDGMAYRFTLIDPENRLCEHICTFPVLFSQDEQSLIIAGFAYERRIGT
jgi:hypothetical protein